MRHIGKYATALVVILGWASGASAASLDLSWTAPGDDGVQGRATSYDLRYSTIAINSVNFLAAVRVPNLPPPSPAGSSETFKVSGLLPGTTYYFALNSGDDAGNWSGISNVAIRTAAAVVDVPAGGLPPLGFSAPWPNPARESTAFTLGLPSATEVQVSVYDVRGRRVAMLLSGVRPAGELRLVWNLEGPDGLRLPTGVYLVRARIGASIFERRVVVVR